MVDDKPENTGRSSGPASVPPSGEAIRKPRTPPTIDLEASRIETPGPDVSSHSQKAAHSEKPDPDKPRNTATGRASIVVISAAAGAIAAVLVGCAVWFAGLLDTPRTLDVAVIETVQGRLARLEQAPLSSGKPDAAISARLDAMEKSLAALRDEQGIVRARGERIARLVEEIKSTSQGAAAAPGLSVVEDRIAQIETTMQTLSMERAQSRAPADDDIPLTRAVVATSLDLAVRQGVPFASTLAAAKRLADDVAVLKPLDGFAESGVPGAAELSRDLLALLAQFKTTSARPSAGTGWFERVQESAARLVRIQRADTVANTVAGNDVSATIARTSAAARRDDIAEAQRELQALAQQERAKVQPWIDKADARAAALAASKQFAANAMTALVSSAP